MDHNMPGMMMPPPPSSSSSMVDHDDHPMTSMAMTHMTFFWGKNSEILFSGWPGERTGMYVLALILVFILALLIEWLSSFQRKKCDEFYGGLVRTVVHGLRVGLGYFVMLAVMSFNVGLLIVAIGGHTLGFFLFGTRVFKNGSDKGFPDPAVGC
ncbi:hypothetical protein ACS0TY_014788 [Phlomoides rotata]